MKEFKFKEITVELFTDPNEITKKFFDIPEDAVLVEAPNSAGFSCIEDKIVSIYVDKLCSFEDILLVVAHEFGHIVTGGFTENPPTDEEYDDLHELKAEHYENFVMDSYELAKIIEEMLFSETKIY